MGAKLVKSKQVDKVLMRDLKDGQIAVIIDECHYTGRLVQRHYDKGIAIGLPEGSSWSDITMNTLEVRVLETGELIEII
jgi:hypothetical protein